MQLSDLLTLLREDFGAQLESADESMKEWRDHPAHPSAPLAELRACWSRSSQAAEMIGLSGFSAFLSQLESFACLCASARESVPEGSLRWLSQWGAVASAYLDAPATPAGVERVIAYLKASPASTNATELEALAAMLAVEPNLPSDVLDEEQALVPDAVAQDLSLSLDDVDMQLFATFLHDAPSQVERLSEFGARLVAARVSTAELQEAQRIAHTFKGSGNIIGLPGIGRMAHRVEDIFDFALERAAENEFISAAMARDTSHAIECLAQMVGHLQGEDAPPMHGLASLQRLIDWVNAIKNGTTDEWTPEPVAHAVSADRPVAQAASVAVVAEATAAPVVSDQLRVGVDRLSRMMRRAGQSLVFADRYNQIAKATVDRLNKLETNHETLRARLRELELSVERQAVTLNEKRDAGQSLDPLEMDRYDTLHSVTRFVAEAAQDELELAQQAKIQTEHLLAMLREHQVALKDQHRELIDARLVPVKSIVARLKRNVSQTAASTQKLARLEVVGESVTMDSDVLQKLTEPLLHLLRNAVDHGIEPPPERAVLRKPQEGVVTLTFERKGQEIELTCSDDGRGLDLMTIFEKAVGYGLIEANTDLPDEDIARLILRAGFSTRDAVTEVSGRGVGLDVVADRLRALKGRIDIQFEPGRGTRFVMRVPVSAGSVHALVVRSEGELVGLSADQVVVGLAAGQGTFSVTDGAIDFAFDGVRYPGFSLAKWLGFDATSPSIEQLGGRAVVIARGATGLVALGVDAIVESRELVLQELGSVLRRVPGVLAASQRTDGSPLFLLDVAALERVARAGGVQRGPNLALRKRMEVQRTPILLVDDALSVRKSMEQLLQDAGYEAITAVDGAHALERLREKKPALVLTDMEMPNMNGMDLTRRIREFPDWAELPVVMITSRASSKHRDLAMAAGVDMYLTKPYSDADLLGHVRRLLQLGRRGATPEAMAA